MPLATQTKAAKKSKQSRWSMQVACIVQNTTPLPNTHTANKYSVSTPLKIILSVQSRQDPTVEQTTLLILVADSWNMAM